MNILLLCEYYGMYIIYENNVCVYLPTYDKCVCEYVITLVSFIEFCWHFDSSRYFTHALRKLLPDKVYRRN